MNVSASVDKRKHKADSQSVSTSLGLFDKYRYAIIAATDQLTTQKIITIVVTHSVLETRQ